MSSSRLVASFVVAPMFLLACSASTQAEQADPTPSPAPAPVVKEAELDDVDACARLCARYVTCDGSVDADTCQARCENENAVFLSKVNADFERELVACIDGVACRELDAGTAVGECTARARARLAPSSAGTKFCDDYAKAASRCGGSVDEAQCYLTVKVYSDDALGGAARCFSKSCSDLEACVRASLGLASDPEPAPAPAACSTKLAYSSASCDACMQASCCDVDNVCAGDATCLKYLECASQCTTTDCASACASAYPGGKRKLESLATCMDSRCSTSCGS